MIDQIVATYIALRDKKAQLKAAYEAEVAPIDAGMKKAEEHILAQMQTQGVESYKTGAGTAYMSERKSYSVADRDEFIRFVREKELWNMLENRINKSAADEYVAEHNDLPPGVNFRRELTVNVRRG